LRAPQFAIVAVLTIGAALAPTLIFSLVGRAVIPPLPFEDSDRLVRVWGGGPGQRGATSYPLLDFFRQNSRLMGVSMHTSGNLNLELGDRAITLGAAAVTPTYFEVLRLRPVVGRLFQESDNLTPFGHYVAILSEATWRERFGARPDVVGTRIRLSGEAYEVVGVAPNTAFVYRGSVRATQVFVPAMMAPRLMIPREWRETSRAIDSPIAGIWLGEARLHDGVALDQARDEARALGLRAAELWPGKTRPIPFDLVLAKDDALDPRLLRAVALLRVAGALVLLLGAINLGSLLVARGRRRENALTIHTLLGAPRSALAAGLVIEALWICAIGGVTAVVLTMGALRLLGILEPSILTAPFGVTFDPTGWRSDGALLAQSLGLAALAAIACGGATAWRVTSRVRLLPTHGQGTLRGGLRALRFREPAGALIALEVALALAITTPALLLTRSLGNLVDADLGFVTGQVATVPLALPADKYPDTRGAAFIERTLDGLRERGLAASSWISCLPIDCRTFYSQGVKPTGTDTAAISAIVMTSAPGAFGVLRVPLVSGRDFAASDRPDGPAVGILSQSAATALGASEGSRVDFAGTSIEVVGVVGDVQYRDFANEPMPVIYRPLAQGSTAHGILIARSGRPVADVGRLIAEGAHSIDTSLDIGTVTPLSAHVERAMARFRGASWLLGAASLLSLWLAGVGIYGMLSMLISGAIPEIGLRLALGSSPRLTMAVIGAGSLRLALGGLLIGGALGVWSARFLGPYLVGVSAIDAPTLGWAFLVAVALATAGALMPARRASFVDPAVVLRNEG
jgi:predicted permease